jgi:pimeloyl-ACP methyl ester carboxylesterase
MREMAEIASGATYLRVPQAGHLIHDECPQVYRDAVGSFLAGPAPRPRA